MSVRVKNNTIVLTRGDTLITTLNITDADGNEYIPDPSDKIRFALKEDFDDDLPILYKEISTDTMELRLDSSDTKKLKQSATYVYDIEITYGDGIVNTIITGKLKTKSEVM